MNTTSEPSNMLGSVYCPSSNGSSYSYTCTNCCCYSGNDSRYPYCCSCASDLIWLWIVLTIVFALAAFGIVKFVQAIRRKRHLEIQFNYSRVPNQYGIQPQNNLPNQGNNIVIHSNNQPNNPGLYRPPVVQPQYQPQYQPQSQPQYQQPVQNNQQGQVSQDKYQAPNAFQNYNQPNNAHLYNYGQENQYQVGATLKMTKEQEIIPSQNQLINEESKNAFKQQEHHSKQNNDYPKI